MTLIISQNCSVGGKSYTANQSIDLPTAPGTDRQALLTLVQLGFAVVVEPMPVTEPVADHE